ncbi:tripartite tricarboxylate transporter substrate binding protein [Pseudorhodoferax sp. Leaf265]|jgi:tripartite-type tricarboxylate transporter receptor subunit TctC|uniref:tripartite tricarboxylate transporter substrate binding protein n=1 Tax=Pseudorhodoferax sp. Leaf265 TaxID=1736315 RepID=UPI0006FB9AE5|nr:tripartite tricarboxylate transporter substrate binding protein [Pseudorhodoferax sp. Leaf265]KQP14469.1 ABC transporter substrate-binding protein [Pseudorhodoferax sp. Leaf265]PZQ00578.1 MAG: tripartite tricarboxylate transporter substrate binding protein [Variovorax paradoxus]PZQ13309.1 MAG: tripartite tricarboxylate transporter substrate binding protein [Variovorax paradoxus]
MNTPTQTPIRRRGLLAACAALALPAFAQSDKPVRLILPISAGSGVDVIARASSVAVGKALGQPLVVENLPGAGGITGASAVAKAAPDGLTLGLFSNNHVINPAVYKKMPFDAIADFTPVTVLGATPLVLVAGKGVAASNVRELVALVRTRPDDFNYASSGNGTIIHLAGEMFLEQAGIRVRHIPYKGTGPMVNDLLGGQVQFGVVALPAIQAHIKSGAVKAIGLCGAQRSPAAPEIPTIAEQGLPDYDVAGWFAVVGPAKLPAAEVRRVHDAFVKGFESPEVVEAMARQGNVVKPTSPEEAAKFFRSEAARYAALAKKANVSLD